MHRALCGEIATREHEERRKMTAQQTGAVGSGQWEEPHPYYLGAELPFFLWGDHVSCPHV